MGIESQIIIAVTTYKLISLGVGALFGYLGYKLFISGIWGNAGQVKAEFAEMNIVLKNAAPGTFFAVCGAIIIGFTIDKGLEFKQQGGYILGHQQLQKQEQSSKPNVKKPGEIVDDLPPAPK